MNKSSEQLYPATERKLRVDSWTFRAKNCFYSASSPCFAQIFLSPVFESPKTNSSSNNKCTITTDILKDITERIRKFIEHREKPQKPYEASNLTLFPKVYNLADQIVRDDLATKIIHIISDACGIVLSQEDHYTKNNLYTPNKFLLSVFFAEGNDEGILALLDYYDAVLTIFESKYIESIELSFEKSIQEVKSSMIHRAYTGFVESYSHKMNSETKQLTKTQEVALQMLFLLLWEAICQYKNEWLEKKLKPYAKLINMNALDIVNGEVHWIHEDLENIFAILLPIENASESYVTNFIKSIQTTRSRWGDTDILNTMLEKFESGVKNHIVEKETLSLDQLVSYLTLASQYDQPEYVILANACLKYIARNSDIQDSIQAELMFRRLFEKMVSENTWPSTNLNEVRHYVRDNIQIVNSILPLNA